MTRNAPATTAQLTGTSRSEWVTGCHLVTRTRAGVRPAACPRQGGSSSCRYAWCVAAGAGNCPGYARRAAAPAASRRRDAPSEPSVIIERPPLSLSGGVVALAAIGVPASAAPLPGAADTPGLLELLEPLPDDGCRDAELLGDLRRLVVALP